MKLAEIIELYFGKAKRIGTAAYQFRGGLMLHMKIESCILTLTLSRPDTCPSQSEWDTILKYFLWTVTTKPHAIGYTLSASFPIHPKYL